ncbi:MAG: SDR family NAD(P)-dependent oxidoreductase, partial [Chloroflexi bacterium]|nr:SDR family NAD(P)-dependent oxidoreductase [Chloroflexota bacterium]
MQLANQSFLISGGASGLGAACARRFCAAGARVVIADVNAEAGAQMTESLRGSARFQRTDVTEEASVQSAVDLAVHEFGGLQGAVNCAGIGVAERTLGREGPHRLDRFVRVVTVNLIGTFNVIRLAA